MILADLLRIEMYNCSYLDATKEELSHHEKAMSESRSWCKEQNLVKEEYDMSG